MGSAPLKQPRWEHHCDECTFLDGYGEFDLYYCQQDGRPTVLARFGDRESLFLCGLSNPARVLQEARRRCQELGLL